MFSPLAQRAGRISVNKRASTYGKKKLEMRKDGLPGRNASENAYARFMRNEPETTNNNDN